MILIGCQANIFGKYTMYEARYQYEILFEMDWNECLEFLTFKNGWWKADLQILKEKGKSVRKLCERYCRMNELNVPFPMIIDYSLMEN